MRHCHQDDRQQVGEAKVKQEHLDQRPVLLVIVVFDEVHLQFGYFLHAFRQLQQRHKPQVQEKLQSCTRKQDHNCQTDDIYREPVFEIVPPYSTDGLQLAAQTEFDRYEVDHHVHQEHPDRYRLQHPHLLTIRKLTTDNSTC